MGASPVLLLLLAFAFSAPSSASQSYVRYLPNGGNVGGGAVPAVGHSDGTGQSRSTNAFGSQFSSNGLTWTRGFCQRDSDGDGLSNGFELGDPCCTWTYGGAAAPLATSDISNPGSGAGTWGKPARRRCGDVNCTNGVDPCVASGAMRGKGWVGGGGGAVVVVMAAAAALVGVRG
jgi:hypothetical protein